MLTRLSQALRRPDDVVLVSTAMPKPAITWVVRFVDRLGFPTVRRFQTEQAAVSFMDQVGADPDQSLRSWAEVWTHEREMSAKGQGR